MKKKQHILKLISIRFRRWSRKGYAAFISRQREVTMGTLVARMADRFQKKNLSVHTMLYDTTDLFFLIDWRFDDTITDELLCVQPELCLVVNDRKIAGCQELKDKLVFLKY